jgi:hypothetical protein
MAFEDGWVRGAFEKIKGSIGADLSLEGQDRTRVAYVLKNMFWPLMKYGESNINIDIEKPISSTTYSIGTSEGRKGIIKFMQV